MVRLIALIISIVLQIIAASIALRIHETDQIQAFMDIAFSLICFHGSPQNHSAF